MIDLYTETRMTSLRLGMEWDLPRSQDGERRRSLVSLTVDSVAKNTLGEKFYFSNFWWGEFVEEGVKLWFSKDKGVIVWEKDRRLKIFELQFYPW